MEVDNGGNTHLVSECVQEPNSIHLQNGVYVPRLCSQALNEDPDNINERVRTRHSSLCTTKKLSSAPKEKPSQMTPTHLRSTANSRHELNSTIDASSAFLSAVYCVSSVSIHVPTISSRIVRQSVRRTFMTHRCLGLCLVLELGRER